MFQPAFTDQQHYQMERTCVRYYGFLRTHRPSNRFFRNSTSVEKGSAGFAGCRISLTEYQVVNPVGTANFYEPQTALQVIAGIREFMCRRSIQDVREVVSSVQVADGP
jgi:hypothetical protein